MKVLVLLLIAVAGSAYADPSPDRQAIDRLVRALNELRNHPGEQSAPQVLEADARAEFEELLSQDSSRKQVWPETSQPVMSIRTLRFVTGDVALADITDVRYGAMGAAHGAPFLLVLKRQDSEWRVVSIRILKNPVQAML